jgi:RluA family pseudouridine synthase
MKVYEITKEWGGSRLDRFVRAIFPGTPFGVIQILLRKGRIFLNGNRADGSVRLKPGDTVAIEIEEIEEAAPPAKAKRRSKRGADAGAAAKASGKRAQHLKWKPDGVTRPHPTIGRDVPIVFEDDSLIVIDKPAGLVVHPGNRKEKGSLLDLLEDYRLHTLEKAAGQEPRFRFTPVHRLDRDTSGVLVIAKTREAARALSFAIAHRLVAKEYVAVVSGVPPERTGVISVPLATAKGAKSRSTPAAAGKEARTEYSVVKTLPGDRALVKVSIGTGRTHQIRAHLASIGHPIVGDREYGAAPAATGARERLFLHAWKIQFPHPKTGKTITAAVVPPPEFGLDDT